MAIIVYHSGHDGDYGNGELISSRLSEGDPCEIQFDFQPRLRDCRVEGVTMADEKVRYDVGIKTYPDMSDRGTFFYSVMKGIDSVFMRTPGEIQEGVDNIPL